VFVKSILFTTAMSLLLTGSDTLVLSKLNCSYIQESFFSEIIFKNPGSDGSAEGELRHYVVYSKGEPKFMSGQAFKSVYYQKNGLISGLIGDEFGTSGSFTLVRLTPKNSGTWRYTSTDRSGSSTEALFQCTYK